MGKDIDSLGLVISREWPISLPIITKVSMFLEVIRNNTITSVPDFGDVLNKSDHTFVLRNIGNFTL